MTPNQFETLFAQAEAGSPEAMFGVGLAFREGDGTDRDIRRFFEWIGKSANTGYADAMAELAFAYRDGEGTDANVDDFFRWLKKSASAGHTEAMRELALAYRDGFQTSSNVTKYPDEAVNPDFIKYVEWLQEAAKLDYVPALYDLAIAYKDGVGVETDENEFFRIMKSAAAKKDPDAMVELAFAYKDAIGTPRRLVRSWFRWLRKAAELDQKDAMLHLAFAYKDVQGVRRRSLRLFFEWLEKSANGGQKDAMFHLAIAYRDGEGVAHNKKLFFEWMEKAAKADIPAAMYQLALAYWNGIGTSKDFKQFSLWIKRALEAGYSRAFIPSRLADLKEHATVSNQTLIALNDLLHGLFDEVTKIKNEHTVRDGDATIGVAHFTTFDALTSMLPESPGSDRQANRLRLYNFAYMNDPMEGKRLFDADGPLRDFFLTDIETENPLSWDQHESSVYIGSFTLRGDELDLWRAYGKDGQGFCIITPLKAFEQESTTDTGSLHGGEVVNVSKASEESPNPVSTILYAIRYEDKDVRKTLSRLKSILTKIKQKRAHLVGDTERLDQIVRLILSPILYLYKHEQYKSEMEARMLGDFDISATFLNLDAKNPSRVYVESLDFLFRHDESRIILGPKVPDQTHVELNLKYRLARNNFFDTTRIERSSVSYR
jgi:TPR repeat protein